MNPLCLLVACVAGLMNRHQQVAIEHLPEEVRVLQEQWGRRMILISEASLHRAASQFVLHYHADRNHQGLENKIIRPEFPVFPAEGEVCCRKRLAGLLRYYYREAA